MTELTIRGFHQPCISVMFMLQAAAEKVNRRSLKTHEDGAAFSGSVLFVAPKRADAFHTHG